MTVNVEHASLTIPKIEEAVEPLIKEETQNVIDEFVEPFRTIVQSRLKLRETESSLQALMVELTDTIRSWKEMKQENIVLEREVLNQIKAKL